VHLTTRKSISGALVLLPKHHFPISSVVSSHFLSCALACHDGKSGASELPQYFFPIVHSNVFNFVDESFVKLRFIVISLKRRDLKKSDACSDMVSSFVYNQVSRTQSRSTK